MDLLLHLVYEEPVHCEFKILNHSYVPNFGEIVEFKPRDFLKINAAIESFENFMWVVGLKSIKYKKERVEILLVLEEEKNFKENHPKYSSVFWN